MALSGMYLMFWTTGVSFFGFSAFFDSIRIDLSWSRAQVSSGPAIQAVQTAAAVATQWVEYRWAAFPPLANPERTPRDRR